MLEFDHTANALNLFSPFFLHLLLVMFLLISGREDNSRHNTQKFDVTLHQTPSSEEKLLFSDLIFPPYVERFHARQPILRLTSI